MLSFERTEFRYEPYPIAVVRSVMDPGIYKALVDAYPSRDLFATLPKVGRKYLLSEKFHGSQYRDFVASSPVWREFHAWIKSPAFLEAVDTLLRRHFIDVGFDVYRSSAAVRWKKLLRDVFLNRRLPRVPPGLHTRFEFSMLPADGGCILPHTDSPGKLVTLVLSMVGEGEWDPAFGGGTDVNCPVDSRRVYNYYNQNLAFDEVEVLQTYEFEPNQCVLFVKTFNSLHSVRPMCVAGSSAMRRTLTINIETDA